MQEVWQSYSEEGSRQHRIAEKGDFKSFTVRLPQERPQLILSVILYPSIIAIFVIGFIEPSLMKPLLLVLAIVFPTGMIGILILRKFFTEEQVIELYDDKIIVKGVNAGTIFFSDIKAYGPSRDRWNINLTIKVYAGEDKILSAPFRNGLEPFITAFNDKMGVEIKEKHTPIKKLTDWGSVAVAVFGVAALLILLLKAFHII